MSFQSPCHAQITHANVLTTQSHIRLCLLPFPSHDLYYHISFIPRRGSRDTFKSYRRGSDVGLSDTPGIIRSRTASLADMPFRRTPSSSAVHTASGSIDVRRTVDSIEPQASFKSPRKLASSLATGPDDKLKSIVERNSPPEDESAPKGRSSVLSTPPIVSPSDGSPSGLSRLIAREKSRSGDNSPDRLLKNEPQVGNSIHTIPTVAARKHAAIQDELSELENDSEATPTPTPAPTRRHTLVRTGTEATEATVIAHDETAGDVATEATLLLASTTATLLYGASNDSRTRLFSTKSLIGRTSSHVRHFTGKLRQPQTYRNVATDIASSIPAVILGLLLNILDGLSYGFIMFPAGSVFAGE